MDTYTCDLCKAEVPVTEQPTHMDSHCPVTGAADCKSRDCELHYMSAPIRLAPEDTRVIAQAQRDASDAEAYGAWAGVVTEFNVAIRQAEEANRQREYLD
jgi:hypothetical protein